VQLNHLREQPLTIHSLCILTMPGLCIVCSLSRTAIHDLM